MVAVMKRDARSWKADVQQQVRTQAVRAVLRGKSQVDVAVTFGVTRQAVGKWMRRYETSGARQLRAGKRGRPVTGGRLDGRQVAAVVRLITDRCPEQLKLPFTLWTRGTVQVLIRR
jgi:transposase